MDRIYKNIKDSKYIKADIIYQWKDETENEWYTYIVDRKENADFNHLLDEIFKDWKKEARKEAWKNKEPIYNDDNKMIGYRLYPERNFDGKNRYYETRLIITFSNVGDL